MIIDETTEITKNAELYAARRYRQHAATQQYRLVKAYNAAAESPQAAPTARSACVVTIPAFDYVKRVARLYAGPVTPTTLRELDHETTQIVILGVKAIVCLGALLVFLAMTIG